MRADIVSYVASTPLAAANGVPKTIQLQGFNPTFGTLTQVTLTYAGEVVDTGKVENTSTATSMSYTLSGTSDLTLGKNGGSTVFTSPAGTFSFTSSGTINAAFDGHLDFAGLSGITYQVQDTVWNSTALYLGSNLADFVTSSLIDFTSIASSSTQASTPANGVGSVTTKAAATLNVEYSYSPIPEPATYAALLGLIVFGFVTIRRQKGLPLD